MERLVNLGKSTFRSFDIRNQTLALCFSMQWKKLFTTNRIKMQDLSSVASLKYFLYRIRNFVFLSKCEINILADFSKDNSFRYSISKKHVLLFLNFCNQIFLILLIKSRMQRLSFLLFFVTGICFAIVSFGRYAVNREYTALCRSMSGC